MTRMNPRLMAGILFVALLTLMAGCAAVLGDDPDSETIADELEHRHDEIEDIQGTQVTTVERDDGTERTVTEVVKRPSTAFRRDVIESDTGWLSAGDVILHNGETVISYDAEENTVSEFEFDRNPEAAVVRNEELISEALSDSEISYEGTDTVADRDVHVITLTDQEADQTTTLWADQEFWYPLKFETTIERAGEERTTTMTYNEVTFNEGVDSEAFEFEPPEDGPAEQFKPPETQTVESAAAVAAATPYTFVPPNLPKKFSFEEGTISEKGGSVTAFMTYKAGDGTIIRLTVDNTTERELSGESVEIGNTEGTISEFEDRVSVAWDCDGVRYGLSGDLDRQTVSDSVTPVDC